MLNRRRPTIYGDGEQPRDFTYVENIVQANIRAAISDCQPGAAINCGCHGQIGLNRVVSEINKVLGNNIRPTYESPRVWEIRHSFAAIDMT